MCARVGGDATSAEALAAVARPLRYNSDALLCSIAGFPRTGCGEQVSQTQKGGHAQRTDSAPRHDSGGPSAGLVGGIAAVVVLGAAGVWQARRRRNSG